MDKNPSEYIEEFLKFIREVPEKYNNAQSQEKEADMETQDILHWTEFNEMPNIDGDGGVLILGVIGIVRRKRRSGKDTKTILQPAVEWMNTHKGTINSLEQLLGDVQKAEKSTKNRRYTERTNIMEQMLGEEIMEDQEE